MGNFLRRLFWPEPNPPNWPESVKVIRPSDPPKVIMARLQEVEDNKIRAKGGKEEVYSDGFHFSKRRTAVLFAPGVYNGIDVEVGYYSQVLGLGATPDEVEFRDCEKGPFVPALNKVDGTVSSLDTFWRSAENFATYPKEKMLWAVSQAAPLRRVHVGSGLDLVDGAAYASGGFMSNCQVDGDLNFGGQQQWMTRNSHFGGKVEGGAWSLVFVGCSGHVPSEQIGTIQTPSITVEPKTPVRIEKPYITLKADGRKYELRVPKASTDFVFGSTYAGIAEDVRDFSTVFVATDTEPDITTKIQNALDHGKDVVLAPGIFELQKSLQISHNNQVMLGLGLATLTGPKDGSPCIVVNPKIAGVRIAGIMLEAPKRATDGSKDQDDSSSLLQWGDPSIEDPGNANNPGALFDLFCRVGGDTDGERRKYHTGCILKIHSGNVIGDNLWLWRADHAQLMKGEKPNFAPIPTYHQTEEDEYRVKTGLEVTGDNVTIYGLAVEHTNEHQTVWRGHGGKVYFYQCELPYGVSDDSFGKPGYLGYLVEDHVETHRVLAAGVYSNFRNEEVKVQTAIRHPTKEGVICQNPFTVHLDNYGCIKSVSNDHGKPADKKGTPERL